jgi:hypothetical protein
MAKKFEDLVESCENIKTKEMLSEYLKDCLVLLEHSINVFESRLLVHHLVVFSIDDELESAQNHQTTVDNILDFDLAITKFKFAVRKYCKLPLQNPKRTYRLPGVVNLSEQSFSDLQRICSIKNLIECSMCSKVLDPRVRGQFFKLNVKHGVMLKELYRKPVLIGVPVKSLSFTWSNNVPLRQTKTVESIKCFIEGEKSQARISKRVGFVKNLNDELDLLSKLPNDSVLKISRVIPPHPRVNIVMKDILLSLDSDVGGKRECQKHGHLPIVLNIKQNPVGTYSIRGLGDNDHERKGIRADKTKNMTLLIERLNLYLCA